MTPAKGAQHRQEVLPGPPHLWLAPVYLQGTQMLEERTPHPAKVSGFLGLSESCGHPFSGGSAQLGTTVRNKDLMTCSVRKILSLSPERPQNTDSKTT